MVRRNYGDCLSNGNQLFARRKQSLTVETVGLM